MFNQLASTAIDLTSGKYPVVNLGSVAAVSYGIQKSPANRPGQHPRPYLRVANVQRGELDLRELKYIDVPDKEFAGLRLEPGDMLFVEGNGSREELGRCALWSGEVPDCVHQNHILKVRPEASRLLSAFAMTWFNLPTGRDHFFRNVKSSSGLGSINSTELRPATRAASDDEARGSRAGGNRAAESRRPSPHRGGQSRRRSDDPGHAAGLMELHAPMAGGRLIFEVSRI